MFLRQTIAELEALPTDTLVQMVETTKSTKKAQIILEILTQRNADLRTRNRLLLIAIIEKIQKVYDPSSKPTLPKIYDTEVIYVPGLGYMKIDPQSLAERQRQITQLLSQLGRYSSA